MRTIYLVVLAVLVASCTPVSPTGYLVSEPIRGEEILIQYAVFSDVVNTPVRIHVYGDRVESQFFVNGDEYTLSGPSSTEGWVRDRGVAVLVLPPGRHNVVAVSCKETLISYDCERIGRDILV